MSCCDCCFCFFFNDTATTEIYTLSLHDALPILVARAVLACRAAARIEEVLVSTDDEAIAEVAAAAGADRKSTRLNSSHANISYAVFCLKKKKRYTIISS